jgi:hypothetical protein
MVFVSLAPRLSRSLTDVGGDSISGPRAIHRPASLGILMVNCVERTALDNEYASSWRAVSHRVRGPGALKF